MQTFSRVLAFLALSFSLPVFAAVPDFALEAYRGNIKYPLVGVVVKAPSKHHFNIKAPMSAKTVGGSADLKMTTATDREIRFEVEDHSIPQQESISVSAYLCDDAKTYCVKKSASVALASAGAAPGAAPVRNKIVSPDVDLPNAKGESAAAGAPNASAPLPATAAASPSPSMAAPSLTIKRKIAQDENGFWNDLGTAQAEARRLGKPLMIDFYGIWCPPCNLFNETVFGTTQFRAVAKKFILLKIDADEIDSWSIKSKFRIGGYPTIVFARPSLEEIDRVVGFYPREAFVKRMQEAFANRDKTLEDRVALSKKKYLEDLQELIQRKAEQKDQKEALRLLQEAILIKGDDPFFKLLKLSVLAQDEPKILKQADHTALMKSIWEGRSTASTPLLLRLVDLVMSHTEILSYEQILWAADAVDVLKTRVNEKSLHLDGEEMSIADLDALRVEIFESAKKDEPARKSVQDTIASYQRLMKVFHGEQSRGFNLELAYFLGKNGQVAEAEKIYEDFMKKYPREFTYYFAAARHYQEIKKDLKRARETADLALKYSYGDNQLRSMARLLGIRAAQGEAREGIEQARAVLKQVPNYEGLSIRTGRYVAALEKAIASAEAGKK